MLNPQEFAAPKIEAQRPVSKPKEKIESKSVEPKAIGVAHKKLEDIAAGKPLAEVFSPQTEQAPLPDREVVSQILTEANSLLLDLKDMRILLAAVATQAADTPMGNEMRIDVLRMIVNMSNEHMAPESVVKLAQIQKKISDLHLPEANPEQSQLLQTISQYNEAHPDKAVPSEILDQLKTGKVESSRLAAQVLQSNTELAAQVWKEITGQENFSGFHPTPENILALTEMDTTPDNLKKMNAIFGAIKQAKEPVDMMGKIVPTMMIGMMGIMFITQIGGVDQGGGGGH